MKEKEQKQIEVLKWFSKLPVDVCQDISQSVSHFLKTFKGIKKGGNVCRIKPCQKHQYSRGLCASHYSFFRIIAKKTSWNDLVKLGICNSANADYKHTFHPSEKNDPLAILIKKSNHTSQ